jgi:NAD(P)-dependent dehydrogenase (short-subunit alcohol dehydrogenase family)
VCLETDKTVTRGASVITGAAGGVGAAVARRMAARRDCILLADINREGLTAVAEACEGLGAEVVTSAADLKRTRQLRSTLSAFERRLEQGAWPLRELVHCAAAGGWHAFGAFPDWAWDDQIQTNLTVAFRVTRAFLPALRQSRGVVLATSSDSGEHPFPGRAAYCASKSALEAMFGVLREEVRAEGVRVSLVRTNRIDTGFNGGRAGSRPEALTADQVADIIEFVCQQPDGVEVRELSLASSRSPYGRLN